MIKKLILTAGILAAVLAALCGSAIWFVKPQQPLDLHYGELQPADKLMDMLRSRSLQIELSEQDINDLAKKQLAQHTELPHGLRMEGARFELHGDQLAADVNLRWQDRVPIGARLLFQLQWQEGQLLLTHRETRIRGAELPAGWLQLPAVAVPLDDKLPPHVGVKAVSFEPSSIRIALKLK